MNQHKSDVPPLHGMIIDPTSGTVRPVEIDRTTAGDRFREIVGGYFEVAMRSIDEVEVSFYLHETGRIDGLPAFAMLLDSGPENFCGPALLIGAPDGAGDDTDLPVALSQELLVRAVSFLRMLNRTLVKFFTDEELIHAVYWKYRTGLQALDPDLVDLQSARLGRFAPHVKHIAIEPSEIGLIQKSMKTVFHPPEFSPAGFQTARSYFEKAKDVLGEKIGVRPALITELGL